MKRLLILFLLAAPACFAQANGQIFQQNSSCTGNFVRQSLPANSGTTTVSVSGTFSATLTVAESNNGGRTWTSAGTVSAAGTTTYSTNGFSDLCVYASAYTSGNAYVAIQAGTQGGGFGGGGSGGGAPSGSTGAVQTNNGSGGFASINSPAGQWQKVGMIMGASAAEQFVAQEPSMISPASPVVLTNVASGVPVCGMYWDTGYASGLATNYAESLDCKNFTPYASNPVVSGLLHTTVTKIGSTYYMAGANGLSATGITVVSSASPLFTSPTTTTSI